MILIQDGYMIDPKSGKEGNFDILIDGDKIVKIAEKIEPKGKVTRIHAEGLLVAPGLVDVHVHFRDPGFTAKEDINTGAAAAAKGGVTTVVLMANTRPTVDSEETLKYILDKGAETGIHVTTCANVTMGMQGKQLTDMKKLAAAGAVGFTDDGVPLLDAELVRHAMEISAELDMPISFHEEDPKYIENNGVNRGKASEYYGIGGSSREAEIALVERDLKLAEETGARLHLCHCSTKESVELVRDAKKKGIKVSGEVCPHHFTLTEDDIVEGDANYKMNPPLRTKADVDALKAGLRDDIMEVISTDHAPHTAEEKAKDLKSAPFGIVGMETAAALTFTELVKTGYLTPMGMAEKMSTNPARILGINKGDISVGHLADITIFDPKDTYEINAAEFASKGKNMPFEGRKVTGRVVGTILDGRIVYQK